MGVLGVIPFNQVTANQRIFINPATTASTAVVLGVGILNAIIVNVAQNTFAIYDAQVGASTNSTQFSGSISTNSGTNGNLLVSYSQVSTSGQLGIVIPQILDVNLPYKNGIVLVGSNVNLLVS